jgi:hypothetical protein
MTVFWSLFVLGLFVWLVFRPYATAPWKILGVFALLLVAQPLTVIALKASSRAHPLKYVLQSLDQALGLTAFQVARLFTPREDTAILVIYELLSAAMIVWYGLQLLIRGGDSPLPLRWPWSTMSLAAQPSPRGAKALRSGTLRAAPRALGQHRGAPSEKKPKRMPRAQSGHNAIQAATHDEQDQIAVEQLAVAAKKKSDTDNNQRLPLANNLRAGPGGDC